ncbi:MAG: hypothetical protein SGILL_005185 [Bacillariaceae sp.]
MNARTKKKQMSRKKLASMDGSSDAFQIVAAAISSAGEPTPTLTPSLAVHELPDADEMLKDLQKEIKRKKLEAKRLFDQLEQEKKAMDEELLEVRREAQLEQLNGNELVKVEHLLRLGFDGQVMKEHLEASNKDLRQEVSKRQTDVSSVQANVASMVTANKESEKALQAARGAYGPLVLKQQTLQTRLEQAEVELYAIETKAKHRKNMSSVELTTKHTFKQAISEIARKLAIRCKDQQLLDQVLQAGKKIDKDLSLSPIERNRFSPMKSSSMKKRSAVSPSKVSQLRKTQTKQQTKAKDAGSIDSLDSISVSSSSSGSGLSSVDVSSVES